DLSSFPPRLLWEFNYDYVNAPGTGRPWPLVSQYGSRYEYGLQILVFAIAATLAVGGLTLVGWLTRKEPDEAAPRTAVDESEPARFAWITSVALVASLLIGIALGPAAPHGLAPTIGRWAWLGPTAIMLVWLVAVALLFVRTSPLPRGILLWLVGAV